MRSSNALAAKLPTGPPARVLASRTHIRHNAGMVSRGMCRTVVLSLVALAPVAAVQDLSSSIIRQILEQLQTRVAASAKQQESQSIALDLPEAILNAYIQQLIDSGARRGAKRARIRLLDGDRFQLAVTADITECRRWARETVAAIPNAQSELEIRCDVSFTCRNGAASLTFESASEPSGKLKREELISILATLAWHQPEQLDLQKPIPLPFGLRVVHTGAGVVSASTQ